MMTRDELVRNRELLTDKAIGALSGLAIGDSLGDAARMPENQRDYGFTTDFNKSACWSTDDTEFALMVAETMIQKEGSFTSEDMTEMWLRHVVTEDELKRGGLSEVEAAGNLRRGLRPPQSGRFNPYHQSDGAAMRSGPIGIYCAGDPEKAAYLAEEDACVSHYGDGIWGAQAVAAAVALAMVDASVSEIWEAVCRLAPEDSWFREALRRTDRILEQSKGDIAEAWMPLHNELFSTHRSTVAEAIPEMLGCLRLKSDSFRSGLLLAANFGRDADTIAATAGAILGARYGASQIPQHWLEKTRYPSGTCLKFTKGIDIFEYGRKLAELVR